MHTHLDITVYDVFLVHVLKCLKELERDAHHLPLLKPSGWMGLESLL